MRDLSLRSSTPLRRTVFYSRCYLFRTDDREKERKTEGKRQRKSEREKIAKKERERERKKNKKKEREKEKKRRSIRGPQRE